LTAKDCILPIPFFDRLPTKVLQREMTSVATTAPSKCVGCRHVHDRIAGGQSRNDGKVRMSWPIGWQNGSSNAFSSDQEKGTEQNMAQTGEIVKGMS
jgi:hypothetical protein